MRRILTFNRNYKYTDTKDNGSNNLINVTLKKKMEE